MMIDDNVNVDDEFNMMITDNNDYDRQKDHQM